MCNYHKLKADLFSQSRCLFFVMKLSICQLTLFQLSPELNLHLPSFFPIESYFTFCLCIRTLSTIPTLALLFPFPILLSWSFFFQQGMRIHVQESESMFYWQLLVIQVTLWLNFVTGFIHGLAEISSFSFYSSEQNSKNICFQSFYLQNLLCWLLDTVFWVSALAVGMEESGWCML